MPFKDRLFSWFIKNILLPKIEIIDKPGFIIDAFTDKNNETYLRDIFIEEQLFSIIEKRIVEWYGNRGRQALYSAGKKFGYVYSSVSNFTRLDENNKKEFLDFAYFLVRYITAIYSEKTKHEIDLKRKRFSIELDNYVVCHENGLGHIMTEGGISGIWAHMVKDKTVEGLQIECQGRGDKKCVLVAQPLTEFKKDRLNPFIEIDLTDLLFTEEYKKFNSIRKTEFAQNSLKKLLDTNIFNYSKGVLTYKGLRYFHCESHCLYLIEEEVAKLSNGENNLFDICFEFGKKLQKEYGGEDYKEFINDYFPALGWGDVFVLGSKNTLSIKSIYYPWTIYSKNSKYIIFRGILSGFISACTGNNIRLNKWKQELTDYLTVVFYEGGKNS